MYFFLIVLCCWIVFPECIIMSVKSDDQGFLVVMYIFRVKCFNFQLSDRTIEDAYVHKKYCISFFFLVCEILMVVWIVELGYISHCQIYALSSRFPYSSLVHFILSSLCRGSVISSIHLVMRYTEVVHCQCLRYAFHLFLSVYWTEHFVFIYLYHHHDRLMEKRTRFMDKTFATWQSCSSITRHFIMTSICFCSMCFVNVMIEDATWLAISQRWESLHMSLLKQLVKVLALFLTKKLVVYMVVVVLCSCSW